uniref:Uncharacterized protein n=1 Tax=Fagus sylvatica TaxID=28930 RepID=A0A2N9HG02_FAGSY
MSCCSYSFHKTVFNVAKVVILALLIFTIKPVEDGRPLNDMINASIAAKKLPFDQEDRAEMVPPSGPDPCTYILGVPGNGHCNK